MMDTSKKKVKRIHLDRAEGPAKECFAVDVGSYEEAEKVIRDWARSAPGHPGSGLLGYDKVDFRVEWEDNENWKGTFDMKYPHVSAINPIGSHIYQFAMFHSGHWRSWMGEKEYAAYLSRPENAALKDGFEMFLQTYDLGSTSLSGDY